MVLRGTINRRTRRVCGCLESFGEVQCYESLATTHPDSGLKERKERKRKREREKREREGADPEKG